MSWLVFRNGADRSGEQWSGSTPPVAGLNVPAGSVVVQFTVSNGDNNPWNYRLQSGAILHDPPAPPAPAPPGPNVDGFFSAIWERAELVAVGPKLVVFKGLMAENINTPERIFDAWGRLKVGLPQEAARDALVKAWSEGKTPEQGSADAATAQASAQAALSLVEAMSADFNIALVP